jgi:GTP cyclohydrolase I
MISDTIKQRILQDGGKFWAGSNISKYMEEGDTEALINELTPKFEAVLESLVIDIENDPNSMETGRRLAKMYIKELMAGRYEPMPNATAFPNVTEDRYEGMLVVRSELKSVC